MTNITGWIERADLYRYLTGPGGVVLIGDLVSRRVPGRR
jgi:hypothetical protein